MDLILYSIILPPGLEVGSQKLEVGCWIRGYWRLLLTTEITEDKEDTESSMFFS